MSELKPENKNLRLKITTHSDVVFDGEVDAIYSRSSQGEFGVLPNHVPFTCTLDIGVTRIESSNKCDFFTTMGGVFQLKDNEALILTPSAENGADIDLIRAKEAKKRAEARLAQQSDQTDVKRAEIALARAMARLKAANRNS